MSSPIKSVYLAPRSARFDAFRSTGSKKKQLFVGVPACRSLSETATPAAGGAIVSAKSRSRVSISSRCRGQRVRHFSRACRPAPCAILSACSAAACAADQSRRANILYICSPSRRAITAPGVAPRGQRRAAARRCSPSSPRVGVRRDWFFSRSPWRAASRVGSVAASRIVAQAPSIFTSDLVCGAGRFAAPAAAAGGSCFASSRPAVARARSRHLGPPASAAWPAPAAASCRHGVRACRRCHSSTFQ